MIACLRWLGATFLVVMFSACGGDAAPAEVVISECSESAPCAAGLLCRDGRCVGCERDRDCDRNELCHPVQRRCELRACFGNDCVVHDDCALGLFCVQGLCLDPAVASNGGCSVISCDGATTCAEGRRCHPVNMVCEEELGCAVDGDCADGERCQPSSGRCITACDDTTAQQLCGEGRFCFEGGCVDCRGDTDCGPGLRCDVDTHTCQGLRGCTADADCAVPLVCHPVTRQCTVDPGPCLSNEDCGDGQACDAKSGKCMAAVCEADRFEPDDDDASLPILIPGRTSELTLCEGEIDRFAVELDPGDILQVVVETDPLLPFAVELRAPDDRIVSSGALFAEATASVAGPWRVVTHSDDRYVRYGLRISVSQGLACPADAAEPNDMPVQAPVLVPGVSGGWSICPGDVDMYTIEAAAGDRVVVMVSSEADTGGLALSLLDSGAQSVLAESSVTAGEMTLEATVAFGTRVYLRVAGATPEVRTSYDLAVEVISP